MLAQAPLYVQTIQIEQNKPVSEQIMNKVINLL